MIKFRSIHSWNKWTITSFNNNTANAIHDNNFTPSFRFCPFIQNWKLTVKSRLKCCKWITAFIGFFCFGTNSDIPAVYSSMFISHSIRSMWNKHERFTPVGWLMMVLGTDGGNLVHNNGETVKLNTWWRSTLSYLPFKYVSPLLTFAGSNSIFKLCQIAPFQWKLHPA